MGRGLEEGEVDAAPRRCREWTRREWEGGVGCRLPFGWGNVAGRWKLKFSSSSRRELEECGVIALTFVLYGKKSSHR